MPLSLFKGDVFAASQTTNRGGAGSALLGIQIAEAVEAIGKVITRGEALARELLLTASTQEAVLMPWLVMVGHTPSGDWLLAVHTLQCKLFLVAGHAVVIVVLRNEALGSNRLLTALAGKAGLMPAVPLMLHLPGAWHDCLLALKTFRGILIGVTLSTQ